MKGSVDNHQAEMDAGTRRISVLLQELPLSFRESDESTQQDFAALAQLHPDTWTAFCTAEKAFPVTSAPLLALL